MRFIRKLFFLFFSFILVWLGIYAYNRATDGFSVHQMTSSLPPCPQFEVALTPEKKEMLQSLVDQPFRYIGKGIQFYVFASADDKYVIKFLKHKHLRTFDWLESIPMPQKLRQVCQDKTKRRLERANQLFTSCKLAFAKMPEETDLVYLHLNRVPALEKQILLIDKMGLKHVVSIDDYEFVIQKKAISVKDLFEKIDPSEVPKRVDQLAELVSKRCQKGIRDRDPSFVPNVAFAVDGNHALFIDIGQFCEDPDMIDPETQSKEISYRLECLHEWTGRFYPSLAPLTVRR